LKELAVCRTAALGGHLDQCDQCGLRQPSYNSCRNRHCPKCQAAARGEWLEARRAELLPVGYFHVVFTLPEEMAQIALQNKAVLYELLFRTSAQTLQEIAADPRHLGATIGFLSVLHTWGQNLLHHPHIHCVVPGGGISPDGTQWIASPPNFFLPVRVLSRVFRGKFLAGLRRAWRRGELSFHGSLEPLRDDREFQRLVDRAYRREWVVYAKPPFGGAEQVLKYLARYTHRVAISNHRLVSMDDDRVTFHWKDYARGGRCATMTLRAVEFLRRFLLHVLPSGFQRLRRYGFLANGHGQTKLELCRRLLQQTSHAADATVKSVAEETGPMGEAAAPVCPVCRIGRLRLRAEVTRPTLRQVMASWPFDSS
jgi:hypothetical protein